MKNEMVTLDNFTVLLGRKPVELPRPVMLKHEVLYDTIEADPYFNQGGDLSPFHLRTVPVARNCQIHSGGRLWAMTNRYTLKKDIETGHYTLRLFKNQTTLA